MTTQDVYKQLAIDSNEESVGEDFEGEYIYNGVKYFITGFYSVELEPDYNIEITITELLSGEDCEIVETSAKLLLNLQNELIIKA